MTISKIEEAKRIGGGDGVHELRLSPVSGKGTKSPVSKLGEGIQSTSIGKGEEEKKERPIESSKKDLLDYLAQLTTTVQWFALIHFSSSSRSY